LPRSPAVPLGDSRPANDGRRRTPGTSSKPTDFVRHARMAYRIEFTGCISCSTCRAEICGLGCYYQESIARTPVWFCRYANELIPVFVLLGPTRRVRVPSFHSPTPP